MSNKTLGRTLGASLVAVAAAATLAPSAMAATTTTISVSGKQLTVTAGNGGSHAIRVSDGDAFAPACPIVEELNSEASLATAGSGISLVIQYGPKRWGICASQGSITSLVAWGSSSADAINTKLFTPRAALLGAAGNDILITQNGKSGDYIYGGTGTDSATIDAGDYTDSYVESVSTN
ncbi:MAG: hypothetical protein QM679_02435 [Patulibacter sp.]